MDDDITIDFSGVKKWFDKKEKSKAAKESKKEVEHKKPTKKAKHHDSKKKVHEEKEDDDVSIDFSGFAKGIKDAFSGKDDQHEKKEDDLAVQVDWGAAKNFFVKHHILLLLLIPLFLSAHFRLYSADLDVAQNWARDSVFNSVRAQIDAQVQVQYPNLPAPQRSQLVEEQFDTYKTQNEAQLEALVGQQAEAIKSRFQDNTGQTYLIAIDPYTFYRQIQNIIDNGHVGDEIRDGKPYDTLFMAPIGVEAGPSFHHYVGYYVYKIWSFVNPNVSLLTTFFYVPVLLCMLAVIPAFFIGRKAGGNVGGLFASVIVAIHPVFISRTAAGFSDTDAYNVLFPLLIAWMVLMSLDSKEMKKQYGFAALAGVLVGFYSFTWAGWWYIFDFILATLGLLLGYYFVESGFNFKKAWKDYFPVLSPTITFFLSSLIVVSYFVTFNTFLEFVRGPFGFVLIKQAAHETLWPNVYTTVAELNAASFEAIVGQSGGMLLFLVAFIGICYIVYDAFKNQRKPALAILLTLWFFGTFYASTKGIRFILLLVPALALGVGVGVGFLYNVITKYLDAWFKVPKKWAAPVIFLMLMLLIWNPGPGSMYQQAHRTGLNEVPSMTDTWWQSLEYIRDNSEESAIITSWWDFGHWFKAVSGRGVTFDGGSQNTPQAHWVGKSLLSNSEEQSVGILRMLHCGGNTAFDEIQKQNGNDTIASVEALYSIFELNEEEAATQLESLGIMNTEAVLAKTHCTPAEGFYITSEDMVGKSGVWAHFGSWNFTRSKVVVDSKLPYTEAIEEIKSLGFNEQDAVSLYNEVKYQTDQEKNTWIAPWPSYQQSTVSMCQTQGEGVICGNGLAVNLSNMDARIGVQGQVIEPKRFAYFDGGEDLEVKEYNTTQEFGAILIPAGPDAYGSILMQDDLTMGMFTRLFYLEGHGLKHFKKVFDQRTVTGWRVIVWKIDWEGTEANTPYLQPPYVEETNDNSTSSSV